MVPVPYPFTSLAVSDWVVNKFMEKPLTARQAIEVRKAWLDTQWDKRFPKGMWKVIRRVTGTLIWKDRIDPNHVYVARPPEFFIFHYTRRPHQSCSGAVDWWKVPKGQREFRPLYWIEKGVCYPPTRTGAFKWSEWAFDNKKAALAKYNQIIERGL